MNLSSLRWFLQRLTSVLLTFFLIVHFIIYFFHLPRPITFAAIVQHIQSSIFWLIFYMLLLMIVLSHSLNGLYQIIEDYRPSSQLRLIITWFLWIFGLITFAWGLQILLTYQVW